MFFCVKVMKTKPVICGIVALGPNNVIGCGTRMPWHSKQDLFHFKYTTMGWPCIFGRNTYEHLPIKPLPGRLNIVCSSSYKIEKIDGVIHVPSLEEGIKQCGNTQRVFVCGGAVLYNYVLANDLIDVMYITNIYLFDDNLKKQLQKTKDTNTYLQYNFDNDKWLKYEIPYAENLLPAENPNIKAFFYKYIRSR